MTAFIARALYCPGCGAPIDPGEASRVSCGYCGSVLEIGRRGVTQQAGSDAQAGALHLDELPLAGLFSSETGRFELSVLEQLAGPETRPDGFFPLTLPEERFALVFLRLTDEEGKTRAGDLDALCEIVKSSLSEEEDPGLAAYGALEYLGASGFEGRLEVAILLFSPHRSTVTVYNAGCPQAVWWVSSEEGRTIDLFRAYPALEKKMLRQSEDHFSNSTPCFLSAGDLIVAVSAAYSGRGGGSYSDGTGALLRSLNAHLGEHPLRVVTLAKNSYWEELPAAAREQPLSGNLRVAAVRAIPPQLHSSQIATIGDVRLVEYGSFEVALKVSANEHLELLPLHDDRACLLWFESSGMSDSEIQTVKDAVLAVLDRRDHGDNENPREAGRRALAALGRPCRLLVLQLLNRWGRVKWFRAHGWQQPLCLGPRGLKDSASAQMFDEGGEATVDPRARLFFPGALPLSGPTPQGADLATHWHGGKASALYGTLFAHWRSTRSASALEKILSAALADQPQADLGGTALVTRKA